jgi:hypothetical protein
MLIFTTPGAHPPGVFLYLHQNITAMATTIRKNLQQVKDAMQATDFLDSLALGTTAGTIAAQGAVLPRMTTAARNALTGVTSGYTIYNTNTNKLNFYNGSAWEAVTSA